MYDPLPSTVIVLRVYYGSIQCTAESEHCNEAGVLVDDNLFLPSKYDVRVYPTNLHEQ